MGRGIKKIFIIKSIRFYLSNTFFNSLKNVFAAKVKLIFLFVANDLNQIRKGNHIAYIIDKYDNEINASAKEDIAKKLVQEIIKNKDK